MSSKGVLPQLTDVLHSLTESQELLLSKIQGVRQAHERRYREQHCRQSPCLAFVRPRRRHPTTRTTVRRVNAHRASPTKDLGRTSAGTAPARSLRSRRQRCLRRRGCQLPIRGHRDHAEPTDVVTPHAWTLASPVPTTTPRIAEAVAPGPDRAASESRNYNFFDDLTSVGPPRSAGSRSEEADPRVTISNRVELGCVLGTVSRRQSRAGDLDHPGAPGGSLHHQRLCSMVDCADTD